MSEDETVELLKGVKPVWESDRYDMPLAGHAWYRGEYGTFGIVNFATAGLDEKARYAFFRAKTKKDAINLMAERQLFEDLVGHHCTYGLNAGFTRGKALDFDAFYGRDGKEQNAVVAYLKVTKPDTEFVGEFEFED